jgi:hypothetical protein
VATYPPRSPRSPGAPMRRDTACFLHVLRTCRYVRIRR